MDLHNHRVVNGILKLEGGSSSSETVLERLSRDVEIVVNPQRARETDLWPCIWALAAILERQFFGRVFINCGLSGPLRQPAELGSRCSFVPCESTDPIRIHLGLAPPLTSNEVVSGDARGLVISRELLTADTTPAHPLACFALAGYLGFAALARAVGIPPYRARFCENQLTLPSDGAVPAAVDGLTLIGLGQLGQAYLALLFFLFPSPTDSPNLILIDKEEFESANRTTQILLAEGYQWKDQPKAAYLASIVRTWGWTVNGCAEELTWSWRRREDHPGIALLGLDDLDVRRMAVQAGFDWIVEAGVGTSFLAPRISWHSIPANKELAKGLFRARPESPRSGELDTSPLAKKLRDTPGQCGWVTFNDIRASAPSMGIAAAAYALVELLKAPRGIRNAVAGRACIWSPLLPYTIDSLEAQSQATG